MSAQSAFINGQMVDKSSYNLTLQLMNPITGGLIGNKHVIVGLKELKYSDNYDFATVRNHGPLPFGRTNGSYDTNDCTIEVYLAEFRDIQDFLVNRIDPTGGTYPIPLPGVKNPLGFYRTPWDLRVTTIDVLSGKIVTDNLLNCRFKTPDHSMPSTGGNDAASVTLTFKPLVIEWNGVPPGNYMNIPWSGL